MRTTTLKQRYYEEDELTNSKVGYPRRQFNAQDNAYTVNRPFEGGHYPRSQGVQEDMGGRSDRLYGRSYDMRAEGGRVNLRDGGRVSLRDVSYEPPRSRYEYQPIPETQDDLERRQAAHSRLYEGRIKHEDDIEDGQQEASSNDFAVSAQPVAQPADYTDYTDYNQTNPNNQNNQNRAYADNRYSYNNDRQENGGRYSYYRPAVVDDNSPARNMANRYISKHAEEGDLRPSTKTMQYASLAPADAREAQTKPETAKADTAAAVKKQPGKALSMVTVYATVFVIIAILIATVGVMISTLIDDVSGLEQEVNAAQSSVSAQQSQLDNYNDDDYIYSKAVGLGMSQSQPGKSVELLALKDTATVTDGNWFDKVCDLLSSIFGG